MFTCVEENANLTTFKHFIAFEAFRLTISPLFKLYRVYSHKSPYDGGHIQEIKLNFSLASLTILCLVSVFDISVLSIN